MDKVLVTLTVFFEDPFWVGVVERIAEGSLSASKITFGAEPKDYEVWDILLRGYDRLRFSPAVETAVKEAKVNPKPRHTAFPETILSVKSAGTICSKRLSMLCG